MRRASFSEVMLLIDDMVRPCKELDAILQHVASWGDRCPHALKSNAGAALVKLRELSNRVGRDPLLGQAQYLTQPVREMLAAAQMRRISSPNNAEPPTTAIPLLAMIRYVRHARYTLV